MKIIHADLDGLRPDSRAVEVSRHVQAHLPTLRVLKRR
jgi:hypothetical protein